MKIVEVEMSGGLGNQLFKWANGMRIAKKESARLILNLDFYKKLNGNSPTTPRVFELFKLPRIADTYNESSIFGFTKVIRKGLLPVKTEVLGENEKILSFSNRFFFVKGNFEQIRFLPDDESVLSVLEETPKQSDWYRRNQKAFSSEQILAVHIRLGDYLHNSHLYNVISENYYLNAIDKLNEKTNFGRVLIFTDDKKSAERLYPTVSKRYDFLDPPSSFCSIELLKLLSSAKGIISTNSTFSWWATYFHKNRQFTVIPEKYSNIAGDKHSSNLQLPGQLIIKN